MNYNFKNLFTLFLTFLKISPVTFGGGYAMISVIHREISEKRKWLETDELFKVITLAQTIPGAIAINSALFIGHRLAGIRGAIASLLGILLPTTIIVVVISHLYFVFKDNLIVNSMFNGIAIAIIALILHAGITIGKQFIKDIPTLIIALISVVTLLAININPIFIILSGSLLGLLIRYFRT